MSRMLGDFWMIQMLDRNHQLSFLKRLPTRKQSSDTVDSDLESECEVWAEQSIETKPDKKKNSGLYEKVNFGLSFLGCHQLDGFRNILEFANNANEITTDENSGKFFWDRLVPHAWGQKDFWTTFNNQPR